MDIEITADLILAAFRATGLVPVRGVTYDPRPIPCGCALGALALAAERLDSSYPAATFFAGRALGLEGSETAAIAEGFDTAMVGRAHAPPPNFRGSPVLLSLYDAAYEAGARIRRAHMDEVLDPAGAD